MRALYIPLLRQFSIAFIVSFLNIVGVLAHADDTIIIGGDHNYPPYEFINKEGEPDGYNTELSLAVAELMGLDVVIQLDSWNTIRSKLDNGEIDIVQGMTYSDERAKTLLFSPFHALISQSIFTRKGMPIINKLSAFKGQTLAVQNKGIMHDYLIKEKVDANLVLVDTHADALKLVSTGKSDYALVANLPGLYLKKELELSNLVSLNQPFGIQRYSFATRLDNTELMARFREGLAILNNSGRQQAIYDKWLGNLNQNKNDDWKYIGQVTLVISTLLLLILGGALIWNRQLAKEVHRRTEALKTQHLQLIQADKMSSLGVLLSGVAHEINNPCSLLLFNLPAIEEIHRDLEDILEDYYQQNGNFYLGGMSYPMIKKELPRMLKDMIVGSKKISRIVSELKDFGRTNPIENHAEVDLNQLVMTSFRLIEQTLRQYSDNIIIEYTTSLPSFFGCAQRIEQVILNLVVNAGQSLPSKDKAIHICTSYEEATHEVVFEVTDQGCGISEEDIKRLTDPFFTTKREQGGTGLGLSISANIVEEHGGQLRFRSEEGKGTQARLILPAYSPRSDK